jgi:hypothetical protein
VGTRGIPAASLMNEARTADERCAFEDCNGPASYHARIQWRDPRGSGPGGLTKPFGFCEEHGRSLRGAPPTGVIWLEYFEGSD